eukprot:Amastigsp_a841759_83.p4 type:complete len:107 gc:universal Amastigsp_a841759_83:780-460(-)
MPSGMVLDTRIATNVQVLAAMLPEEKSSLMTSVSELVAMVALTVVPLARFGPMLIAHHGAVAVRPRLPSASSTFMKRVPNKNTSGYRSKVAGGAGGTAKIGIWNLL